MHRDVFARYGLAYAEAHDAFELDHLIPLELGGDNSAANLWPQPNRWSQTKDDVENYLHRKVCAGKISIGEAQGAIGTDWVSVSRTKVSGN